MLFFRKKSKKLPKIEFSGVILEGGIGVFENASASKSYRITAPVPAFVTLTPPRDGIIEWVSQLQNIRRETTLAVNLRRDIQRTFALLYDFVDFLIVDTISDDGTAEVPDITVLLDELLSLRLCYERYTPVLLRITDGLTPDEISPLLDYCRLSGIDGLVVHGEKRYSLVTQKTQGRLPVIVNSNAQQEILDLCAKGVPVETQMGNIQRIKLLKSLKDNA